MPYGTNVALIYDGTFDGLLSALWFAFSNGFEPAEISKERELLPIFTEIEIITDGKKSERLSERIDARLYRGAAEKIWLVFLSDKPGKERLIYEYISFGLSHGEKTERLLGERVVSEVEKAARSVLNEAHHLKGFLRFSDCGGTLCAVIEPKAAVLALIAGHFAARFPKEKIVIYDKPHDETALAYGGNSFTVRTDDFSPPAASPDEQGYRTLWKEFYDTVAIKERKNEACRMRSLPKRFWHTLTEMDENNTNNFTNRRFLPE